MVVSSSYVPRRGDVVWITFTPQSGREQAGRRPAVVVSPERYNSRVGLALFCPVTNQNKGYPFEVPLPEESGVTGVVLADQVKNLDWRAREATFISALPVETITAVLARINVLLAE